LESYVVRSLGDRLSRLGQTRPRGFSLRIADQHPCQQSVGVLGDILPCEFTLAFRRAAAAARDQPAQAAVSGSIRRPQYDSRGVYRRDLRADNQL
jgi:hypothetical protein